MKIKAILHDWDDTITNAFEAYSQFYFDLGEFYNLDAPSLEKIKKHWGGTIPEIVNGVWPLLTPEEAEIKTSSFVTQLQKWRKNYIATIFPDVKETIFKLEARNIKLGVISSGDSVQMKRIYKEQIRHDLTPHCFIYDTKELGYKKPDARVFDRAFEELKEFNISEKDTIYVGDSFQDYYSAKNRGLTFYAVTTGVKTKEDFIKEGLHPDCILQNFSEVLNIV
jgi:HAD superfamily hydrolase (TIGR01549 family)